METERLRYFCVIAETGSLTKASELLGISHSGLSKSMSVLQDELKQELLRPHGRGLVVTDSGRLVYQKCKAILAAVTALSSVDQPQPEGLRIGMSEVISSTMALDLVDALSMPLEFIHAEIGGIEHRILDGALDFGFVLTPVADPLIEHLKIGEIRFGVFGQASGKTLNDLPFVVPASSYPGNPMSFKHRDGWPDDVYRHIRYRVSGFDMALALIESGKAIGFIPEYVAHRVSVPLKRAPDFKSMKSSRPIFLAKSIKREECRAMKKATSVIRRICKRSGA